jgi:hypothetical protein
MGGFWVEVRHKLLKVFHFRPKGAFGSGDFQSPFIAIYAAIGNRRVQP